MNKNELIEAIAEKSNLSKAASANALDATLETIKGALSSGDSVSLIGFGTFTTSKSEARTGRNPQTGESMEIPAKVVPKLKFGKPVKDLLNK